MTAGPNEGQRPRPADTVESVDLQRFAASTAPRPGRADWVALAASSIGSVHVRDGRPLQDAALTWADGDRAVVAVSDGHGHRAHFRSETGAALAVVSAVEVLRTHLGPLAELAATGSTTDLDEAAIAAAAAIVQAWRTKVAQHREANPFTEAEEQAATDALGPYGATLVVAGVTGALLVFLQIGDGDAVVVGPDGVARRPLPADPDLDGVHTHSLCQPDPLAALRVGVVDTTAQPVALVYLCTDGFGNSRVDTDGWWRQTGEQLLGFARERGVEWVRDQLGSWLEEPAAIGGDDTSLALLVRAADSA